MTNHNYHDLLAIFGVGGAHPGGILFTKEILNQFKIDKNSKILDAGCGTGQTAAFLAKHYDCHVTALDNHPVMIQKAKQRANHINIVQGDAERQPFESESFDFIIAESVTVFTDIFKTAKEYHRVLKPGGILIDLDMTAISSFTDNEGKEFNNVYGIRHVPTEKEWENYFIKAGFQSFQIIKEKWVSEEIMQQVFHKESSTPSEATELDPSDFIDPKFYEIWDAHQSLTEKYADNLKYNVYCATKEENKSS